MALETISSVEKLSVVVRWCVVAVAFSVDAGDGSQAIIKFDDVACCLLDRFELKVDWALRAIFLRCYALGFLGFIGLRGSAPVWSVGIQLVELALRICITVIAVVAVGCKTLVN